MAVRDSLSPVSFELYHAFTACTYFKFQHYDCDCPLPMTTMTPKHDSDSLKASELSYSLLVSINSDSLVFCQDTFLYTHVLAERHAFMWRY